MEKQKSGRTYPENDTETLSNIRFSDYYKYRQNATSYGYTNLHLC